MVTKSFPLRNSHWRVFRPVAISYRSGVDIRLIRRANLDTLIAEAGTIAELARRTGVSEKYIRQIVSGYSGKGRKSRKDPKLSQF